MKKVISLLLALVMVISIMPKWGSLTSSALGASGSCGENVTYTFDSKTGTLTISGSGAMYDYNNSTNSPYCFTKGPFYNQTVIRSVVINYGVTRIGTYSFIGCSGITSIVMSNSITSIGKSAFNGCSGLTSIAIPNSVTSIDEVAFPLCSNLESFIVDSNNANYCSVDGVLFDKNKSTLVCYPISKNATNYEIPSSVTSISESAFYKCTRLTSIEIPNSVTNIGKQAFYGCDNLQKIVISGNLKSIETHCFSHCPSLTSVVIPNSVNSIGIYAFVYDSGLLSVTIPKSVTEIEAGAFQHCTSIKDVYYAGTKQEWNNITINNENGTNSCLTDATIHYNSTPCTDHIIEIDEAVAPTCTEMGLTEGKHCSVCSQIIVPQNIIPKLGHDWGDWSQTCAPNCTIDGEEERTCSRCTETETRSIDYLGHNYGSWIVDKEATCTDSGQRHRTCSVCGTTENEVLSAPGHDYSGEWTVDRESTCTQAGSKSHHCTRCDSRIDITTVDAKGHNYNNGVITKAPTCTEKGIKTFTCSKCQDVYTREVPATGHSYNNGVITKVPTCTDNGIKTFTCSKCQDVYTQKIPATGHSYDCIEHVDNSCTTNGYSKYKCNNCGHSYTDILKATGHNYCSGVCTNCKDWTQRNKKVDLVSITNAAKGINVKWKALTGADRYLIYRKTKGTSGWTLIDQYVYGTSFIDTEVKSGTSYTYTVKAHGGKFYSKYDTKGLSIIRLTNPSVKTSTNKDTIKLSWNKVTSAKGYYVYRKTGSGSYSKIATTSSLSYLDKTAKAGTEYTYAVRAYNGGVLSAYTGINGVILPSPSLKVTNATDGAKISWKKLSGAKGYLVYRKTGNGNYSKIATTSSLSYLDKTAKSGTTYTYAVKGYNGNTYGPISSFKLLRLSNPVAKTANNSSGIKVSWAKVSGAKGYYVYRKTGSGSYSKIGTASNLSYVDKTAKAGTKYTYTVKAYNGSYASAYTGKAITVKK